MRIAIALLLIFTINFNSSQAEELSVANRKLKQIEELEKSLNQLKNDIEKESEKEKLKAEVKAELIAEFKEKEEAKKLKKTEIKTTPVKPTAVFKKPTKAGQFAKANTYFTIGYVNSNLNKDLLYNNHKMYKPANVGHVPFTQQFILSKEMSGFEFSMGNKLNKSVKNRFFLEFNYMAKAFHNTLGYTNEHIKNPELDSYINQVGLLLNYERTLGNSFYLSFGAGVAYNNLSLSGEAEAENFLPEFDVEFDTEYLHGIVINPRIGLGMRVSKSVALELLLSYNKYFSIAEDIKVENTTKMQDSLDITARVKFAF